MKTGVIVGFALLKLVEFSDHFREFNGKYPFLGSLAILGFGFVCILFGATSYKFGITVLDGIPILQMGICLTGLSFILVGLAAAVGGFFGAVDSVVTLIKINLS